MTDEEWLRDLFSRTWRTEERSGDRFHGPYQTKVEVRMLTQGEWDDMCRILAKEEFMVLPSNGEFGFQHAIDVFAMPEHTLLRSHDALQFLIRIVSGQLPWAERLGNDATGRQPNNAWDTFFKFTGTPKQAQYRQFYNINIPMNEGYWDY